MFPFKFQLPNFHKVCFFLNVLDISIHSNHSLSNLSECDWLLEQKKLKPSKMYLEKIGGKCLKVKVGDKLTLAEKENIGKSFIFLVNPLI